MLLLIFFIAEICYISAESLQRILFEDSSDEWNVEEILFCQRIIIIIIKHYYYYKFELIIIIIELNYLLLFNCNGNYYF